ncbi:protease modulator HflC [Calycomorphotria hydatis]|uniref:Protein HflC n=1 Tax=Calycomorphotria hydatis TaxID=2528027 RepID=A0A517TA08_9PLAN|nr:protease modulator HflC [Calycomorphotria hydatis]QDT65211.1 Modulator of FtsH protease HflC [Calycomorphotria hydatis]
MSDESQVKKSSTLGILSRWTISIGLVALLVGYSCYVQVPEGWSAVIIRFGQPIRELREPGPYFKLPWPVEDARMIDVRQRIFNTPYTATLTRDRRNVVLLTYVVWHVAEPQLFLQSVGSEQAAAAKLDGMVTAAKNTRMGGYDLSALVSTDQKKIQTPLIEAGIEEDVRSEALEKFGIAVEQVGFKRIAYEEANIASVLANMRAEREAEAKQLRALGDKEAKRIRDDAAVRSEVILRDGRLEAGKIRGEAEREAAEIYAKAHQTDPEFYRYWRSLEALKKTLGQDATVVLRTDQGFFDLLTDPPDAPKTKSVPAPVSPEPADQFAIEPFPERNGGTSP